MTPEEAVHLLRVSLGVGKYFGREPLDEAIEVLLAEREKIRAAANFEHSRWLDAEARAKKAEARVKELEAELDRPRYELHRQLSDMVERYEYLKAENKALREALEKILNSNDCGGSYAPPSETCPGCIARTVLTHG